MMQAYFWIIVYGYWWCTRWNSWGMKVTTVMVLLLYAYWSIRDGRVNFWTNSRETISKAFIIAVGSAVYIVIAVILLSLLESNLIL